MTDTLPTVVVSSVVRSTHQGESHGGVHLVDLAAGTHEQVLDWDDPTISFEGRGKDRGLRGIAFHDGHVLLAASEQVLLYDRDWTRVGVIGNAYLAHCHEIDLDGDTLYLTSTGYDSVLAYDLRNERFTTAWHLSWSAVGRTRLKLRDRGQRPVPRVRRFDPQVAGGPEEADTCHINNVVARDGRVWCSGVLLGHLLELVGDEARSWARVPYGTHNAQPVGDDSVLCNDTEADAVTLRSRDLQVRRRFEIPRYDPATLTHTDLPGDHARQAFGRGLTVHDGRWLIGGSSPATVTVHDLRTGEQVVSVNLTRDIRNAVHGLEVWPF